MSCNDMLRIGNKTGHDTLIWFAAIPGTLALPPWQDYDGIRIYPYSPRHGKFPGLDLMWYPCGFIGGLGAQVPGLFLHRCVNNAHERNWWISSSLKKFIGGCHHFLKVTWLIFRLTSSSVFSFLTLFFAGTACDFLWSFLRLWSTGPNCRADCSENSYWCPLPEHGQDLPSQFWRLCCPGWGRPSHENRAPGLEPVQTKQPHR